MYKTNSEIHEEVDGSEEYLGDTVSNKIDTSSLQKLSLTKINTQSGSTMASNHSKKGSLDIDSNPLVVSDLKFGGNNSPSSKQNYESSDWDEHYDSGIFKVPRRSPKKNPSNNPFGYSFFSESSEGTPKECKTSFVDRVVEYNNTRKTNSLIECKDTLSPTTNAETTRKISCLSCEDPDSREQMNLSRDIKKNPKSFKSDSKLQRIRYRNASLFRKSQEL